MSKSRITTVEPVSGDDLAESVLAIAESARAQAASSAQIMQLMQQMMLSMQQGPAGGAWAPPGPAAATAQINIWEEDPFTEEVATTNPRLAATVAVAAPVNNQPLLQTRIVEPAVAPGQFAPGTQEFRFWVASEALARGINFWAPLLPSGTRWTTSTSPMPVGLVAGTDLNAFYSRAQGLRFFRQVVRGVAISSAESADVVCHELGHALLDAIRPQLFSAASLEVAAFHESFGDMSGILCALQLPSLRQKVLSETGGRLNENSRLSRLAEQLGWGIRQAHPTAVDPDCLRNAANDFFYRNPTTLPPGAPSSSLSSESHSFSRVFTGAFLDALARMLPVAGGGDRGLVQVARDMGRLLVNGIRTAPIVPRYYAQVAAAMIQVDRTLFQGRYRDALGRGFVQHGILGLGAAAELDRAPAPRLTASALGNGDGMVAFGDEDDGHARAADDAPELPTRVVETGLGIDIEVHAAAETQRFAVGPAAAFGRDEDESPQGDAAAFVDGLIRAGCIDMRPALAAAAAARAVLPATDDESTKTHTLVRGDDGTFLLKRLAFDCGLGCCRLD